MNSSGWIIWAKKLAQPKIFDQVMNNLDELEKDLTNSYNSICGVLDVLGLENLISLPKEDQSVGEYEHTNAVSALNRKIYDLMDKARDLKSKAENILSRL